MKGGDAFYLAGADQHLWVILSDPDQDADRVVAVSFTTLRPEKDQACLVSRGAHPRITHDSCVAFDYAKVLSLADLFRLKDAGLLKLEEPTRPELLAHMRKCTGLSVTLEMGVYEILEAQGLVGE